MGIMQMISSLKFNRQQKSQRKKMHERENSRSQGVYGKFEDHREMKGHEFAEFQKELFRKKKEEQKRHRQIILLTILITLAIIIAFLVIWNNYDLSLLAPSGPDL